MRTPEHSVKRVVMRAGIALVVLASPLNLPAQDPTAATREPGTSCNFRSSPYAFFPPGALAPDRLDLDAFTQCWYGVQLSAMGEPVLFTRELPKDAEVYRFTWLRTFHRPIAVRVEREGTTTRLIGIELDGAGGYAPGKPVRRVDRALSAAEWTELRRHLEAAQFWMLSPASEPRGTDGAEWILEGRARGQYRVVVRWTPDSDGSDAGFRAACVFFLSLAGLLPERMVY